MVVKITNLISVKKKKTKQYEFQKMNKKEILKYLEDNKDKRGIKVWEMPG